MKATTTEPPQKNFIQRKLDEAVLQPLLSQVRDLAKTPSLLSQSFLDSLEIEARQSIEMVIAETMQSMDFASGKKTINRCFVEYGDLSSDLRYRSGD